MALKDPSRKVGYGETGQVMLTTLTKEFFMPRFLERDGGRAYRADWGVSLGRDFKLYHYYNTILVAEQVNRQAYLPQ